MRRYKSESRILNDINLFNVFMNSSLKHAKNNKELVMNELFIKPQNNITRGNVIKKPFDNEKEQLSAKELRPQYQ
jgi:hypothetical protein